MYIHPIILLPLLVLVTQRPLRPLTRPRDKAEVLNCHVMCVGSGKENESRQGAKGKNNSL